MERGNQELRFKIDDMVIYHPFKTEAFYDAKIIGIRENSDKPYLLQLHGADNLWAYSVEVQSIEETFPSIKEQQEFQEKILCNPDRPTDEEIYRDLTGEATMDGDEKRLANGAHIKLNGDIYKIIGSDDFGYKIKPVKPNDNDEYKTHVAFNAPFEVVPNKGRDYSIDKDNLNLVKLLRGYEGEKIFSMIQGIVTLCLVGSEDDKYPIHVVSEELDEPSLRLINGKSQPAGLVDLYPSEELLRKYPLEAEKAWEEWAKTHEPRRWRAKRGEKYYVVDENGHVDTRIDDGSYRHELNFMYGNYFHTIEEARRAATGLSEFFKNIHNQG